MQNILRSVLVFWLIVILTGCDMGAGKAPDVNVNVDGRVVIACDDLDGDGYCDGPTTAKQKCLESLATSSAYSSLEECLNDTQTKLTEKGLIGMGDCGPLDADVNPGAPEIFDGKDNDCDGKLAEGECSSNSTCASADEICDAGKTWKCVKVECVSNADCDDTDPCNGVETCDVNHKCVAGTSLNCNDNNPCTEDRCSAGIGCVSDPLAANTACNVNGGKVCDGAGNCVGCNADTDCDDGIACNGVETCGALTHTCSAGTPPDCNDNDPTTTDTCDPFYDHCVNLCTPNTTNTTDCEVGGEEGLKSRTCSVDGIWSDWTVCLACDDHKVCTLDSISADWTVCINTPITAGTVCNNNGVCDGAGNCVGCNTDADCADNKTCSATTCVGVPCPATDACDNATVINHLCTHAAVPNCCLDDSTCSTSVPAGFTQTSGKTWWHNATTGESFGCLFATATDTVGTCDKCMDQDNDSYCAAQCTTDADCSDKNICNGTETCSPTTHTCVAGTPIACNDNNSCTSDSCDATTGCTHTFFASGTACAMQTGAGVCDGEGVCKECNSDTDCNDGNTCTTETCVAGTCVYVDVPNCQCTTNAQCALGKVCDTVSHECKNWHLYAEVTDPAINSTSCPVKFYGSTSRTFCWDHNQNGICDLGNFGIMTEDVNGDGKCEDIPADCPLGKSDYIGTAEAVYGLNSSPLLGGHGSIVFEGCAPTGKCYQDGTYIGPIKQLSTDLGPSTVIIGCQTK